MNDSLKVNLTIELACILDVNLTEYQRTILLTTPTTPLITKTKPQRRKNSDVEDGGRKNDVNPIYWWIVQPQEETGLKEGRFSLARSSQRKFPYDQQKVRRSSSLYTDSSGGNLSRTSSISMSTLFSSFSLSR